jgi:cob(I)alamin adenosyltransferase
MSIVTKTGDQGETGRFGGGKIKKDDISVCANGDVDELNSAIGLLSARSDIKQDVLDDLKLIQSVCFSIGAEIAIGKDAPRDIIQQIPRVLESDINFLESRIFEIEKSLPSLSSFLLPGGHPKAAMAFWIRSVTRRAERSVVSLSFKNGISPLIIKYLNRLSDYFYVLARFFNLQESYKEEIWRGDK